MSDWFSKGMEAALLAPTAMNQQKFYFTLENGKAATKNYYYFDPDMKSFDRLIHVLQKAKELTAGLPDRGGEN